MKKVQQQIQEKLPSLADEILQTFDAQKVAAYYDFLEEKNEVGGFFSKQDTARILERHILESICFVYYVSKQKNVSRETQIADVGTGPGLPGYLFLCLISKPNITFIDSQKKRLALLQDFTKSENMDAKFLYKRVEEIRDLKFDIAVTRAVIPYPFSVEVIVRILKQGGFYIPFLGKKSYALDKEKSYLKSNGYTLSKEIILTELDFLGERHIKFLKKERKAVHGYPRTWKQIHKEIKENHG
ncbi:MAG: RsmG family class I SAM-dependent methyltransferase [Spirochaetota bacterium]